MKKVIKYTVISIILFCCCLSAKQIKLVEDRSAISGDMIRSCTNFNDLAKEIQKNYFSESEYGVLVIQALSNSKKIIFARAEFMTETDFTNIRFDGVGFDTNYLQSLPKGSRITIESAAKIRRYFKIKPKLNGIFYFQNKTLVFFSRQTINKWETATLIYLPIWYRVDDDRWSFLIMPIEMAQSSDQSGNNYLGLGPGVYISKRVEKNRIIGSRFSVKYQTESINKPWTNVKENSSTSYDRTDILYWAASISPVFVLGRNGLNLQYYCNMEFRLIPRDAMLKPSWFDFSQSIWFEWSNQTSELSNQDLYFFKLGFLNYPGLDNLLQFQIRSILNRRIARNDSLSAKIFFSRILTPLNVFGIPSADFFESMEYVTGLYSHKNPVNLNYNYSLAVGYNHWFNNSAILSLRAILSRYAIERTLSPSPSLGFEIAIGGGRTINYSAALGYKLFPSFGSDPYKQIYFRIDVRANLNVFTFVKQSIINML